MDSKQLEMEKLIDELKNDFVKHKLTLNNELKKHEQNLKENYKEINLEIHKLTEVDFKQSNLLSDH